MRVSGGWSNERKNRIGPGLPVTGMKSGDAIAGARIAMIEPRTAFALSHAAN
jgi:hypothetical protein